MTVPPAPLTLSLPARAENVAIVRHVLGGVAEAVGLGPDTLDDLRLAVSEACTNVVVHAYVDGPADGILEVDVVPAPTELAVVVRDHGRGMGPRPDSPGLGVGLPLIAALSDAMEIGTAEDGATEVRIVFDLSTNGAGRATRDDSVAA